MLVGCGSGVLAVALQALPPLRLWLLPPNRHNLGTYAELPVASVLAVSVVFLVTLAGSYGWRMAVFWGASTGLLSALLWAIPDALGDLSRSGVSGVYRGYVMTGVLVVAAALAYVVTRWSSLPGGHRSASTSALATLSVALLTMADAVPIALLFGGMGLGAGLGAAHDRTERLLRRTASVAMSHPALLVLVIAFIARAAFSWNLVSALPDYRQFAWASDDGPAYHDFSTRIVRDPGAIVDVFAQPTFSALYGSYAALLFWLSRGDVLTFALIQSGVGVIVPLLGAALTSRLAGPGAALLAGVLLALNQNLAMHSVLLATEALFVPFVLAACLAALRYRSAPSAPTAALTGVMIGLAIAARNLGVVFVPILLGVLLLGKREGVIIRAGHTALAVGFVLLPLVPTALATTITTGVPRLTNQQSALAWSLSSEVGEEINPSNLPLVARGIDPMTDPAGSLRRFVLDPLPVIAYVAQSAPRRALTLLSYPSFGLFDPLWLVNQGNHQTTFGPRMAAVSIIAFGVGAASLWARTRRTPARAAFHVWWLCILAYLAFFSLLIHPEHPTRYRVPLEPFFAVGVAVGVAHVALIIRARLGATELVTR